jgi:hypothetical protein
MKHLHLYQINGRIRLGEAEPIRSESKPEYQMILCEGRKLAGKYKEQRNARDK